MEHMIETYREYATAIEALNDFDIATSDITDMNHYAHLIEDAKRSLETESSELGTELQHLHEACTGLLMHMNENSNLVYTPALERLLEHVRSWNENLEEVLVR